MPVKRVNKNISRKKKYSSRLKNHKGFIYKFWLTSSLETKSLFAIGVLLVIIPTFFYINEFVQLSFFTPKVPKVEISKKFSIPIGIQIPSVNINLQIDETVISNNTWQISGNGISHLDTSARPGESGPIILYGHNTNDRFGPIRWLKSGEEITLTTQDGRIYLYTITKTIQVDPSKTSIFSSEKGETLFLYTCDGFADLKRFIVIAKPI
ncbi:MAG TPA: sortase [Patescibacteria group bacterium]